MIVIIHSKQIRWNQIINILGYIIKYAKNMVY